MSHLSRKNLRLLLLTLLAVTIIIILRYSGIKPIQIGPVKLPVSTIGGVLSGNLSLICILLVFVDYKIGFRIGVTLNLIASANLFFGMISSYIKTNNISNTLLSMPGVVTNTVSLLTLITIFFFYRK